MKCEHPSLYAALLVGVLVNVLLRSQTAYWCRAGAAAALVCAPVLAAVGALFAVSWRQGATPLLRLLFALLLLITASVELALYHYARQVVGQEYIRLNQAGLRQISYTLGQGMTDTQTLAKRIAESTQLIELLSGPAGERADEAAHDLLYSLSSDYVWQRGIKMLMDSYVVGFNGVTAATYSSRQFNYDAVLADPRYGPLFSGTQDALLLPTTTHPEATPSSTPSLSGTT